MLYCTDPAPAAIGSLMIHAVSIGPALGGPIVACIVQLDTTVLLFKLRCKLRMPSFRGIDVWICQRMLQTQTIVWSRPTPLISRPCS